MKTYFNIFLFLIFLTGIAGAQSDDSKTKTNKKSGNIDNLISQTGLNGLMGQFVKGINTSSFSDGKTGKNEVLGMLKGVNASDYLKYAGVIGSLAGALKGSAFLRDCFGKCSFNSRCRRRFTGDVKYVRSVFFYKKF